VNISIVSELEGNTIKNEYRNMSSRSIIDEINLLTSEGHKITRVIDLDEVDPLEEHYKKYASNGTFAAW
jgi:hypothetical protein